MQVSVALLTLFVVTFLHVVEPMLCPDGCREEAEQGQSASDDVDESPTDCLICHNGVSSAVLPADFPAAVGLTDRVSTAMTAFPFSAAVGLSIPRDIASPERRSIHFGVRADIAPYGVGLWLTEVALPFLCWSACRLGLLRPLNLRRRFVSRSIPMQYRSRMPKSL